MLLHVRPEDFVMEQGQGREERSEKVPAVSFLPSSARHACKTSAQRSTSFSGPSSRPRDPVPPKSISGRTGSCCNIIGWLTQTVPIPSHCPTKKTIQSYRSWRTNRSSPWAVRENFH